MTKEEALTQIREDLNKDPIHRYYSKMYYMKVDIKEFTKEELILILAHILWIHDRNRGDRESLSTTK